MRDQLDRIEQKVDDSIAWQKRTHRRVFGDDDMKQDGLVDDVEKNTKHRRRSGFLYGIAAGIGVGLKWIWEQIG